MFGNLQYQLTKKVFLLRIAQMSRTKQKSDVCQPFTLWSGISFKIKSSLLGLNGMSRSAQGLNELRMLGIE